MLLRHRVEKNVIVITIQMYCAFYSNSIAHVQKLLLLICELIGSLRLLRLFDCDWMRSYYQAMQKTEEDPYNQY